ncbi:hypothetical protein [Nocardiopsis quinghaiensis]|uniref:hypothetical protein n=1 Tax=Nocardiopsis quinghaiensis TaxID=464995 RepID=UPI001CC247F7|nr:hypothetical protein [Nocardiopsis quinghaiensis]
MSEDVIRPRPVVDPDLPEDQREEVRRKAESPPLFSPRGGGEVLTRLVRIRECGVHLFGVGFTTALALLTAGWYLGMVITSISLVAYVAAMACRRDTRPATRAAGVLVGAGTIAFAPAWLTDTLPQDPFPGMPWVLFGLLVITAVADTLTTGAPGRAGERYREHVVLPDDLSGGDHALLLEVQHVIDLVDGARDALGGEALDTDRALAVLREEEWRIASLLARQRELRRAHLRRWQSAVSPRVREALKPQREHLHAVAEAVRSRVAQISEYGRLVRGAAAAHREWEQCQEAVDSTAEYADHLASASFLGARSAEVSELAATAAIARRVRDERVEQVLLVGCRLVASSEPDDTGAPGTAGPDGTEAEGPGLAVRG